MERFAAVEESPQASQLNATTTPATREQTTPTAQATETTPAQNSETPSGPDIRAAAEQKPTAPAETKPIEAPKPAEPQAKQAEDPKPEVKTEPEKSRYAKSQERLTKTWEQVNADKAAIAAEKTRLETERAEFARKQAEFDAIRKQAEQPKYTADDYLASSQQKRALADHQRAEAKRHEDAGRFTEAEKLNKAATKNDALAEDLAEYADRVRKNPPASLQQLTAQYEQARKFYTVEAAKAFPDLVKENSPFQQAVARELTALAKSDPTLAAHPSVIYHASRLVSLETRAKALEADAARVPELQKETEALRAKIKELEALTAPASGGGVSRIGTESRADDYNTLRQAAIESGNIFR